MVRPPSPARLRSARRRAPAALALALAGTALALTPAGPAAADLQGQIGASRNQDQQLRQGINADRQHAQGFAGRIADLRMRLDSLQQSLTGEQDQLANLQGQLRNAKSHLTTLRLEYVRDRGVLARQVVAQYEAPQPSLVGVILGAHGFADLLETADRFKEAARQNAEVATNVKDTRTRVARQTVTLTNLEVRQERVTQALLAQRDQIAQLKLAVVDRQLVYLRAQSRKSAQLAALRQSRGQLERRLAAIQARERAAIPATTASAGPGLPSGGAPPWSPHSGAFGFFQAPGTNYSVGDTPLIAARLDVMGKALQLHLIGISGYRSPQHSVEVGGFANDPHTRGQASDTPGLEGVPEGTLNKYGLTRPFGGVAELDHVQLVGSI